MEKRIFSVVAISHLSNDNANSLFKSTGDIIIPVRTQLGDMINAVLDVFLPNAQKFGEQVNAQRKSKLTELVTAIDKKNDKLLAEIKRTVVYISKSRDVNQSKAAHNVDFFFSPFWNAAKKPIKTQADDFSDMFVKYHADSELMNDAALVGITQFLDELEVSNNELVNIYLNRNEETGARGASGSDLRPAVSDSYAQLCSAVEQAVNFTPNDTNVTLFNNMDALRRKYAPLATGGKDKPAPDAPKE